MAQKESLAAQAQKPAHGTAVATVGVELPAVFGENAVMEMTPRFSTPYLIFAQPKAQDQWKMLVQRFGDIEDGDPVMIFPEPEPPLRLSPLRLTILAARQYWAEVDTTGMEVSRSKTKTEKCVAERIWSALIVYTTEEAIACTCKFKTVKCAGAHTIKDEIDKAALPEWASGGVGHQAAIAACSVPYARVVGTISIAGRTSRFGKGKGNPYRATRAIVAPSGPAEWKLLAPLQTPDGMKDLKAVADAYKGHLAELGL